MCEQTDSRPPIRILYVVGALYHGGTEHYLVQLLKGLDPKRFAPQVAVFSKEGPLLSEIKSLGIPVYHIKLDGAMFDRTGIRELIRLTKWIRESVFDIVHALLDRAMVYGAIAGRLAQAPLVVGSHRCFKLEGVGKGFLMAYYAVLTGVADHVLANSQAIVPYLQQRRIPCGKISVIPNGIDIPGDLPEISSNIESGCLKIVVVGGLREIKGHCFLLHAFADFQRIFFSAKLLIVGDGRERAKLEKLCHRLNIDKYVTFSGYLNDPLSAIAASDIGVLPSLSEGFPNVVLEYMLAGKPVVATEVGGVPWVVRNGIDGLIVPSHSSEALTSALSELAESPQLRIRMGTSGQKRVVEEFTIDKMIAGTEAFYVDRLGGGC